MTELSPSINQKNIFLQEAKENGLNNFYSDVPGGYRRIRFQNKPEMLTKKNPNKRMGKSTEEYWTDIDNILKQEGVDEKKVISLQEQIRSSNGNRDGLLKELDALLMPAYVCLRMQGYSQSDIWS